MIRGIILLIYCFLFVNYSYANSNINSDNKDSYSADILENTRKLKNLVNNKQENLDKPAVEPVIEVKEPAEVQAPSVVEKKEAVQEKKPEEQQQPEKVSQPLKEASPDPLAIFKKDYIRPTEIPYPDENPFSQEKHDLGKMLYFDPRLSSSQVMSCATCHNPSFAWGDALPKGVGHGHKELGRKTPTILNLAWDELFFWDGRADSLEQQALGPIESKGEMNQPLDKMVASLQKIEGYKPVFHKAFPDQDQPITKENVAKSIATYERSVVSGEAPFDRWIKGDETAISPEAKKGFELFNTKANCVACHSGWNFSDNSYHDIGLKSKDVGRYAHLKLDDMKHAFKTVGLRNIAGRKPYMHDGSLKTLEDVIEHYNNGFVSRPSLSSSIKKLDLTSQEKKDLVAFLNTLTSADAPIEFPLLPY